MSSGVSIVDILSGQVLVCERFEKRVLRTDGCWEWQGAKSREGYGKFYVRQTHQYAHRVAYQYVCGPLPSGIYVCHKCDNPKCVRPDHLFAGTAAINNRDMWEKGRGKVNGVPHPGENNPQAVLTEHEVDAVRRLVLADVPQKVVAEAFGVSITTVSDIIRGKKWKN